MSGSMLDPPGVLQQRWSRTSVVVLLAAIAVPLFFVKLGAAGLVDPDEPYYAVPALEMLKSGTWAVPLFRGQPWFDKPVLFYWIVLAAYKIFGVSEWAARIGSALAGLGGVIALALFAPTTLKRGGAHVLAAIVLGTSVEYALLARSGVTDMTLTFLLTLGMLAAARHLEAPRRSVAIVAGAMFGLATLTKGPVGALVPALALAGYGLATRRRELLDRRTLLATAAGFAVTAAPWYLYMLAAHRDLVLSVFLGQENLGRFMTPEHRQVPLYYVWVLAAGLLPWSAALPPALARAVRDWRRGGDRTGTPPGRVFALAWFLAIVGLFSLSASKLSTYVLPAFPAAAWLIADYWRDAFAHESRNAQRNRGPLAVACVGGVLASTAAAGIFLASKGGRFTTGGIAIGAVSVLLVAASVAAVVAAARRRMFAFAGIQAATTVGAVLILVVFAWPGLEPSASTRTLVRRLANDGLADRVAGAYRVRDVSLDYYLGRTISRESDSSRFAESVRHDPASLWIVPSKELDAMATEHALRVEPVLTEARLSVVRFTPGDPAVPARP